MRWDIFCKVIDNHGDIGVCWRLAVELAARGHTARLRVDDAAALAWMAPQGARGVQVSGWDEHSGDAGADAVIEAFGCDPPPVYLAALRTAAAARGRQAVWINLEYLSAEAYVERSHGLPSPVSHGPAAGLLKHFFYPGFTPRTGGLLRERDLDARQAGFDASRWLSDQGIPAAPGTRVSLFGYEPPGLGALLDAWIGGGEPVHLLVTAGRAARALDAALAARGDASSGALRITRLPLLTQRDYDHLLWSCDLNFVRGEDSLVRALWAGRPFVWQPYPQSDGAHAAKLDAFLDWLAPPPGWRDFQRAWSGLAPALPRCSPADWSAAAAAAGQRARALPELTDGLERFVIERGRI